MSPKESKTIIIYRLTNHTDFTYYFNLGTYNEEFENTLIKMDKVFLKITDSEGNGVKVKVREPSIEYNRDFLISEYLDYRISYNSRNENFIIHPNETLYFEWFVVLPFGNIVEQSNYQVELDSNKKYLLHVLMNSDSTSNKLSRTDLKTIRSNGYHVYHGTIKSKNKIPVVFSKASN